MNSATSLWLLAYLAVSLRWLVIPFAALLLCFVIVTPAQKSRNIISNGSRAFPEATVIAQAGQVELTGEVRDQTGALISDARVSVTEVRTNQIYASSTGTSGTYTLTNLKPGLYKISLEAKGFALIKRTYINERINVEFRAEAFNLTNTPPLGAPNVVLGTPGFGSITSAGDPRVIQFGLKVNF